MAAEQTGVGSLRLGAEDSSLHHEVGGGLRGVYRAGDHNPLLGHYLVVPARVEWAVGSCCCGGCPCSLLASPSLEDLVTVSTGV